MFLQPLISNERSVRQGCVLISRSFSAALQWARQDWTFEDRGFVVGHGLQNLVDWSFVDDMSL